MLPIIKLLPLTLDCSDEEYELTPEKKTDFFYIKPLYVEKKKNKYDEGKIYKLVSDQTTDVYYGSTCKSNLYARFVGHKSDYKKWLKEEKSNMTSFKLLKYDDCRIELVETYPCESREQLEKREGYYIKKYDCVNKIIPKGNTKEKIKCSVCCKLISKPNIKKHINTMHK